ncbi:hypothetical protein CesoFtcFv8_001328 [Champsocephalus esox]|uniref:Uncharacterized protein n=1 Tax=Champsocephalus esox TaxID=159716 RepID=A0AAN8D8L4_9TELE|nr:hypothetical protein CesoFtcFv8_001328 [Champsocephalus esox]
MDSASHSHLNPACSDCTHRLTCSDFYAEINKNTNGRKWLPQVSSSLCGWPQSFPLDSDALRSVPAQINMAATLLNAPTKT